MMDLSKFPVLKRRIEKLSADCDCDKPLTRKQLELIVKHLAEHGAATGMDTDAFKESVNYPH